MASINTTARNAAANGVTGLLNSGTLRIYSGAAPADANAALGSATLLAQLPLSATAFGAAVTGAASANAITAATAAATGTASFFRLVTSAGVATVQGTVGTSGAELNLTSTAIQSGTQVSVSAFTFTQSAS